MDFTAEKFPLYQRLLELNEPGIEAAKADFAAACAGGEAERFQFAMGIQTVVFASEVDGMTDEMAETTLRSCLEVFEEVAKGTSKDAATAQSMVDYYQGLGLES